MATMMIMLLLGTASAGYQGGGDQTYDTEDEHLGHGGPGGNGPDADEDETGTSPAADRQPTALGSHGTASASYQGGGKQTYHTEDEHLGHGAPVGNGSIGMTEAAVFMVGIFAGIVLSFAAWYAFSFKKTEQKPPQYELELTVGADLEEAVERVERKDSKNSQISIAASDVPLHGSGM